MDICFSEEFIYSLPERNIIYGNQQISARIDIQNGIAYTLDENKKWDKKFIRLPNAASCSASTKNSPSADERESESIPNTEDSQAATTDGTSPFSFIKTKKGKTILIIVLILVLFLAVHMAGSVAKKMEAKAYTQAREEELASESTLPSEPDQAFLQGSEPIQATQATLETVPMVQVAICSADIIPGTEINESLFITETIPQTEYRALTVAEGIYTWDDLSKTNGMYITEFLPAGSYLPHNAVTSNFSPINPWSNSNGICFELRIADISGIESYSFGNSLTLEVSITKPLPTPVETDATTESVIPSQEPEGFSTEATTSSDGVTVTQEEDNFSTTLTYTLTDIKIVDLLNSRDESLFSKYAAYSQIPAAYRYDTILSIYRDNKLTMWDEYPTSAQLLVTPEQFDILNNLPSDGKIIITNTSPALETPLQEETYKAISATISSLKEIWMTLNK